ncbi:hypothetical protein PoB_006090100 [Plakobranchus ocellatus]|uniref:Uncharacterized protein n=1 Tax=Plakobranchus ocellatus TaxID=259542 RepID=A0AAV4CRH5_9GAST|nr:hypothetical protein PoB_006090100 [Plakobranchus ocellatus]
MLCETEVKCINGTKCVTTNQAKDKELPSKTSGQCRFDLYGGCERNPWTMVSWRQEINMVYLNDMSMGQCVYSSDISNQRTGEGLLDHVAPDWPVCSLKGDHYSQSRTTGHYNAPIIRANIAAARQIDLDPGTNGGGSTDRPAGSTQSESFSDETKKLKLSFSSCYPTIPLSVHSRVIQMPVWTRLGGEGEGEGEKQGRAADTQRLITQHCTTVTAASQVHGQFGLFSLPPPSLLPHFLLGSLRIKRERDAAEDSIPALEICRDEAFLTVFESIINVWP